PDEAELSQFYEENKQFFQAPEVRTATIAKLSIEELADTLIIDDQEVADTYAERLNLFRQPERREILQGIFLDQESADKAKALIDQGRAFAEAVEEVGGFPPVPMGTLARTEISEEDLAVAAFIADVGAVTDPVESPLGWHLLSIVKILPEETRPLSEVREPLRRAIAMEQARDDIFDVVNTVDDGLAAGATLEEVAQNNSLNIQKFEEFNAGGFQRGNQRISMEPLAEIVNAVFTTAEGEISDLVETNDGGFFVVRTDTITAPQIEPLEQVRDQVTAAWLDRERLNLAIERATELADRARAGGNLEQLAEEFDATFETTPPFDRTGLGSTIAGSLITPIFAAKRGDVVQAQTQAGVGVAKLVEINRVTGGGDEFERDELRQQIAEGINRDVALQLTGALRDRVSIDVDRDAIEQLLQPQ
ncbi:MAG: peptidyl-prolyl cis-trans isomerase, partial [Alphaproteobacteria bacterium]|nr:peptidyl-prolyl cis-trans isomerase [Alphaproteobacteria bacterium]